MIVYINQIPWKVKVASDSLQPYGLYSPWNSSGQNTGVGSLSLLQGIFPTQGSSPVLPHCRWILYQLSHKGSPRILEWVAYPFSSRSSRPGNQTRVSWIAGGFFTNRAIRESQSNSLHMSLKKKKKMYSFVLYFLPCWVFIALRRLSLLVEGGASLSWGAQALERRPGSCGTRA